MAQAHRKRKPAPASAGIPGWFWLLLGLGVGLAIAVVFYLQGADRVMLHSVQQERSAPRDARDVRNDATAPIQSPDRARFEYYDLLPRDTVDVPGSRATQPDARPETPARKPTEARATPPDAARETSRPTPAESRPSGASSVLLQTGSFQRREPAEDMRARLILLGLDARIQTVTISGREWHRVHVGPLTDERQIQSASERLRANNIEALRVSAP